MNQVVFGLWSLPWQRKRANFVRSVHPNPNVHPMLCQDRFSLLRVAAFFRTFCPGGIEAAKVISGMAMCKVLPNGVIGSVVKPGQGLSNCLLISILHRYLALTGTKKNLTVIGILHYK